MRATIDEYLKGGPADPQEVAKALNIWSKDLISIVKVAVRGREAIVKYLKDMGGSIFCSADEIKDKVIIRILLNVSF